MARPDVEKADHLGRFGHAADRKAEAEHGAERQMRGTRLIELDGERDGDERQNKDKHRLPGEFAAITRHSGGRDAEQLAAGEGEARQQNASDKKADHVDDRTHAESAETAHTVA